MSEPALHLEVNVQPRRARFSWPDIPQFPELAPFERHVAMLLVQDASREAMAQALDVGLTTISTAAWRLQRKLNVNGLAGLARLAIRRGYIEP